MLWTKLCTLWRVYSYCWEGNANFLCVANYPAQKLFKIELRPANWSFLFRTTQNFTPWLRPKFTGVQCFLFPKPLRYEMRGTSQHSGVALTHEQSCLGVYLGFSRGGDGFSKNVRKLWPFLSANKLIFRDLPKHCFAPILAKFCALHAKCWKTGQKSVLKAPSGNFRPKNCVFSAHATSSKLIYIGALRKFLGSIAKNGYLKLAQGGDPLSRQGSKLWGERTSHPKLATGLVWSSGFIQIIDLETLHIKKIRNCSLNRNGNYPNDRNQRYQNSRSRDYSNNRSNYQRSSYNNYQRDHTISHKTEIQILTIDNETTLHRHVEITHVIQILNKNIEVIHENIKDKSIKYK